MKSFGKSKVHALFPRRRNLEGAVTWWKGEAPPYYFLSSLKIRFWTLTLAFCLCGERLSYRQRSRSIAILSTDMLMQQPQRGCPVGCRGWNAEEASTCKLTPIRAPQACFAGVASDVLNQPSPSLILFIIKGILPCFRPSPQLLSGCRSVLHQGCGPP